MRISLKHVEQVLDQIEHRINSVEMYINERWVHQGLVECALRSSNIEMCAIAGAHRLLLEYIEEIKA